MPLTMCERWVRMTSGLCRTQIQRLFNDCDFQTWLLGFVAEGAFPVFTIFRAKFQLQNLQPKPLTMFLVRHTRDRWIRITSGVCRTQVQRLFEYCDSQTWLVVFIAECAFPVYTIFAAKFPLTKLATNATNHVSGARTVDKNEQWGVPNTNPTFVLRLRQSNMVSGIRSRGSVSCTSDFCSEISPHKTCNECH